MFGFSAGTMLMKGGGSSGGGGGGGGIGAPGSDVGRGGGGRAGSSSSRSGGGGRDDNDRGPGTNPGRPGGESGDRGSSVGSIGGTNPGRPGGESGMRGPASPNVGGGSDRGGSSSGTNNESVSGSGRARDNFSVTNRSSSNMMSFGSRRDANVGTVGGFRGARSLGGRRNSSLSAGSVTDGLDRSMGVYDAVVGDGELSKARQARERFMSRRQMQPPDVRARATEMAVQADKQRVEEATDDNPLRAFVPAPIEAIADLAENAQAAKNYNQDLQRISEELSLVDGYFGETNMGSATEAAIGTASGGFFGDQNQMAKDALALNQEQSERPGLLNRGGGGGNDEPYIPPVPAVPAPTQSSESEEAETGPYGGSLGDYSSYARRFFSRV